MAVSKEYFDELARTNANVRAFLLVIRDCEGTAAPSGYTTLFGYGRFTSTADHPNITVKKGGYVTTAAGAYQFLYKTWKGLVAQWGFPDFTPRWQDAAAVALVRGRGALADVLAGRWRDAEAKCGKEWASFPSSPYGQPVRNIEWFLQRIVHHGGVTQTNIVPTAPIPTVTVEEHPVALPAILGALLPSLISAAPDLVKLFQNKDKPVAERNTEAALKVFELAQEVTGAVNEQQAVEEIKNDPTKAEEFRNKVKSEWFQLEEASRREAREFVTAYSQLKDVRTVLRTDLTFPEFLSLVFLAISTALVVALLYLDKLSGELLGGVVTLVIVAGFTEIRKFWFGNDPSPVQRDEQLVRKETI